MSIGDAIKAKNYARILKYIKIESEKDENGKLIISHYKLPKSFDFKIIGVDEQDLINNISQIQGDADFSLSRIKTMGGIKSIGGNAILSGLSLEDMGKIESIGGDADFRYSQIQSLYPLKNIGGNLNAEYAEINDISSLLNIGGNTNLQGSNLTEDKIKRIKDFK